MKIDEFKIEKWFNSYEKYAQYDLADTCVEPFTINELLTLTKCNIDELLCKKMNYGDITGSYRLKNAIASLYESQVNENITITHGGIGANHLVFETLLEPNDEVVVILPIYQQHYSVPKLFGAKVKLFFLVDNNGWLPELEKFSNFVTPKTKLICMNNPNNPTGAVMDDALLAKIVDIARKNDSYILCDEVYRGLEHDGICTPRSIVDIYPEKGISTSSMSKIFSLAGLRLGWICANKNIISAINSHREYSTISVGILDDFIASIALENKNLIEQRNLAKIKIGKSILMNWVKNEPKVSVVEPSAGTTVFVKYDADLTSFELCKELFKDSGVLLLPGETMEYDRFVRIGYGNNFKILERGLEIFSHWLQNF